MSARRTGAPKGRRSSKTSSTSRCHGVMPLRNFATGTDMSYTAFFFGFDLGFDFDAGVVFSSNVGGSPASEDSSLV